MIRRDKLIFSVFLLATGVLGLYSCLCSCKCHKRFACVTLTATNGFDSIIDRKTFCSKNDVSFEIDTAINDSITNFNNRNQFPNVTVTSKDSVFHDEFLQNIKCGETKKHEDGGFVCNCAK